MYRHLDIERIVGTLSRLRDRIRERFPSSGLCAVAEELLTVGTQTRGVLERIRRPNRGLRVLVVFGIALIGLAMVTAAWITYRTNSRAGSGAMGASELWQGVDAAVNEIVLIGAAIYFLVSFERRLKRRISLRGLHELRSIAHVIDAHQLTKDPEQFISPRGLDTSSSPDRALNRFELARYLDYCSELLSLTAKLAALYAQCDEDPVVLRAVNDVESLASSLSQKIWQKMTILDTVILRTDPDRGTAASESPASPLARNLPEPGAVIGE